MKKQINHLFTLFLTQNYSVFVKMVGIMTIDSNSVTSIIHLKKMLNQLMSSRATKTGPMSIWLERLTITLKFAGLKEDMTKIGNFLFMDFVRILKDN